MSDIRKHKATQIAFAAHIRNPEQHPKPDGIDDERMQVYRDLFINNIAGLIRQAFPVLASLHESAEWTALIRDFYQKQHNRTPYFTEIAGEFLQFLQQRPTSANRPFMYQLAHYEWLELDLEKDPQKPAFQAVDAHQLNTQIAIVTPLIRVHSYQYPVHQIGQDFQPVQADEPHHLMVWKDRHQKIHFATINDLTRQLLKQLQTAELTGEKTLRTVFRHNNMNSTADELAFGRQQLFKWHQQDIIINAEKEKL